MRPDPIGSCPLIENKHYIYSPTGRIAVRTERNDTTVDTRYFHTDGLGSVTAVTNESGQIVKRFAFDAWGKRVNPSTNGVITSTTSGKFTRGYTDHEQLDDLGLVHMNGRIYDPVLGRFLSADPTVDGVSDAQGFNRYSYVGNNPMNATDPSGYFKLRDALKIVAVIVITVVAVIVTYGAAAGWSASMYGLAFSSVGNAATMAAAIGASAAGGGIALGAVVAGGFASGFAGSLLNGGSVGDAFRAGVIGAGVAALTAGIAGINYDSYGEQLGWKVAAHGTVGGLSSELSGGSFRHGFMASAASAGLDYSGAGNYIKGNSTIATRTARAAIIGGSVSAIGGGKFANGAVTSAFQHLFNNETNHSRKGVRVIISDTTDPERPKPEAGGRDFDGASEATGNANPNDTIVIYAISTADALSQMRNDYHLNYGSVSDLSWVGHGAHALGESSDETMPYFSGKILTVDSLKPFEPFLTSTGSMTFYGCYVGCNMSFLSAASGTLHGRIVYGANDLYEYRRNFRGDYSPLQSPVGNAGFNFVFPSTSKMSKPFSP